MTVAVPAIVVAGASRGVGFEVVKILRQQGCSVLALLHSEDTQALLIRLGATAKVVNLLDPQATAAALAAWADRPLAVVTTVGGTGLDRKAPRADYWANRNLIDAVNPLPCQRFLLVSALGAGRGAIAAPALPRPVLLAKTKAEEYLIASGLPYTILRLGKLRSPWMSAHDLTPTRDPGNGDLSRLDAAAWVVQCLRSPHTYNQILAVEGGGQGLAERL